MRQLTRRRFLQATGLSATALGLGCGPDPLAPTPGECGAATEANIEGPFYRDGAPFRSDLAEAGELGTRLLVSGLVVSPSCERIEGAVLDLWQADDAGAYDNNGFTLRGRVTSDSNGAYEFQSIVPGHYLNGNEFRPAHVHVKVSAVGYVDLTTQLYFEGDPHNEGDPFLHPSLIMPIEVMPDGSHRCVFDFVLSSQI